MNDVKVRAIHKAEELADETKELCKFIHDHPELGFQEVESSAAILAYLQKHGFQTEAGAGGMDTAFRAVLDSGKPGPTIAFLCEYDALPEIGHGCGHNIIGSASAAAAAAAWEAARETGGRIVVLGCPAEEGGGGGKERLIQAGFMDDVDCALMSHPGPWTSIGGSSLANQQFSFVFHGQSAHAAATPEQGINALEAVIQMFNQINALRPHLPVDSRVNGIITKGGTAPNIIPDLAEARFNIRADSSENLKALTERIFHCAQGAALGTGCTVDIESIGVRYDNVIPNQTLQQLLAQNLEENGEEIHIRKAGRPLASTDIGNVTHRLPAIQAMFCLAPDHPIPHSLAFTKASGGENGGNLAVRISKVLCGMACDLLEYPEYVQKAKDELKEKQIKKIV